MECTFRTSEETKNLEQKTYRQCRRCKNGHYNEIQFGGHRLLCAICIAAYILSSYNIFEACNYISKYNYSIYRLMAMCKFLLVSKNETLSKRCCNHGTLPYQIPKEWETKLCGTMYNYDTFCISVYKRYVS